MSDLIAMIAVAKGTIPGSAGIIHVDPRNRREDGRYSHPRVCEVDARALEKRKLAVRETDMEAMTALLVDGSGAPVNLDDMAVKRGEPIVPGTIATDAPPVASAAPVAKPAAPAAGEATGQADDGASSGNAGTNGGADEIATGLSENDPDAPPVASAAPVAKPAAPAAGKGAKAGKAPEQG